MDKELLTAIGVLTGGIGALLGSIAKLIEVLRPKKQLPKRQRRRIK